MLRFLTLALVTEPPAGLASPPLDRRIRAGPDALTARLALNRWLGSASDRPRARRPNQDLDRDSEPRSRPHRGSRDPGSNPARPRRARPGALLPSFRAALAGFRPPSGPRRRLASSYPGRFASRLEHPLPPHLHPARLESRGRSPPGRRASRPTFRDALDPEPLNRLLNADMPRLNDPKSRRTLWPTFVVASACHIWPTPGVSTPTSQPRGDPDALRDSALENRPIALGRKTRFSISYEFKIYINN